MSVGVAPRVLRVLSRSAMVPEEAVTPETTLAALGIDSLDWIECMLALEDELQVELPDPDPATLRTVQDVVDIVERHLADPPGR